MTQTKKKTPKPVTAQRLMNAATYYLGRFEATQAKLTRVLEQKVRRWSLEFDVEPFRTQIDETVAKCVRLELVDDARYGELRARQLLRKGKSARLIGQDLRHKGLDAPLAEAVIGAIDSGEERKAAAMLAKRRRLGPFRGGREAAALDVDPNKQRGKEIAVFARAGHSYQTASAILSCADTEALERWVAETA